MSESSGQQSMDRDPVVPSYSRIARLLVLLGLLVLLLWLGLKSWRVYQATQSLLTLEREARALVAGGLMAADPDALEALVLRGREDISTLHRELGIFRPIAPYLGWIPRFGPALVAAPYLLDMADAGSEAGAIAVSSLKPALVIAQSENFGAARIGEVLPTFAAAAPELEAAAAAMGRYAAARESLSAAVAQDALPWRVRRLLELSDQWQPAAENGLRLAPHLPLLLGQDKAKRYLIMAQNEDELRATGGFLTGAGVITIENGRIIGLDFRDANGVDNWQEKPYSFPPQPLYDLMGLELFLFRDANYWPDFPTSAQKAMELYVYGQDAAPLDGAIAIDQEFLRLLVDATGPIPVAGTDQTINADNLLQTLRAARDIQEGQAVQEWVRDRKAFLGGFAAAIQSKVESDFTTINPIRLVQNLANAAGERHLSLYMVDPSLAETLAEAGWDGHVPSAPPGDLWMAVDTNMGYNKANVYVERSLRYEVTLARQPSALLTLDYRHNGPPSDEPCYQGVAEEFELATDYLTLADQCYWNFLRVYVPRGSQLIDSSNHFVAGETLFRGTAWESEAQIIEDLPWLTTFANFMLLQRAGEVTAYFQYQLPEGVIEENGREFIYRLLIPKQPGTRAENLSVAVVLPEGSSLRHVTPAPTRVEGNRLVFETVLDRNLDLTIRYR